MRILLLMLVAWNAWAVSETVYVRSTADCAANGCGAENGDTYATAYDGFIDVCDSATEETANCLDPDDTLVICGTFLEADIDVVGGTDVMKAIGTVSRSGVTYDGDCSAHITNPATWTDVNGVARSGALINGEGAVTRGFDSGSSATNATGATFKNMAITGFTSYGIISQALNSDAMNWTFTDLNVYSNRGATARGIWGKGTGTTLTRVMTSNCGEDCLYWEGDSFTATDHSCVDPGLDAGGNQGDCIQMTNEIDSFSINNLICRMSIDVKQCFIGSDAAGTISGTLQNSECYGPSATAANHNCFFFRGTGAVAFHHNYGEKSQYLAYAADGTIFTAYSNVGRQLSANGIQCGTSSGVCTIRHNSIYFAPTGIDIASAASGSTVTNNALGSVTTGIKRASATGVETYNNIFGATTACSVDGGAGACGTGTTQTDNTWVGGLVPTTPAGFRLTCASPLRAAGTDVGRYQDYGNRAFNIGKPSIGAWEHASGDDRCNITARSNTTSRTSVVVRSTTTAR